ncbi:MAG TPA: DUF4097 family beta strand repeat-containing protein [Bryobacteraceae bacterium]|jgi:hypothetical protein|nr:DUF4097 family beta strand repeat-containing protein [Bryobacteraceae bacterium]
MKRFALGLISMSMAAGIAMAAGADGSFDRTLSVSGPVELDVKTDSGGIAVSRGAAGTVRIHAVLTAQHNWFGSGDVEQRIRELEKNPPVEQSGKSVRVGYVRDRDLLKGISMRLEIETPADTELRAEADSGGIRAHGMQGRVNCKTDSGGIEIQDAGSDVHAQADSGGIHINNVKGSVFARVDSGGIEATEVTGSLDTEADSGHIQLSQTSPGAIRAKAESGGISVKLAPGAGYDISAEADSGHISVPEMVVSSSFSRHHIEGKIRGGGPLVSVRVDSGGITID